LKLIQEYYEISDKYICDLELIEYDLIESGVVGADIRNKLTPVFKLLELLKKYFKIKNEKGNVKKFIDAEIKESEKSIEYISNLL